MCWVVRLQDKTIGWAATKIVQRKDGITDLYSRVYLGGFSVDEIAPGWLTSVLRPVLGNLGKMDIDKKTQLVIDPLGAWSDSSRECVWPTFPTRSKSRDSSKACAEVVRSIGRYFAQDRMVLAAQCPDG